MTAIGDQLALDVAPPPPEPRYVCCDMPCGPLSAPRSAIYRHADDCSNPNVGTWIDRATGWPLRRLHCVSADGTCPHGGRHPDKPGLADPYNGACCLELRADVTR
jgi:hypothetical protein